MGKERDAGEEKQEENDEEGGEEEPEINTAIINRCRDLISQVTITVWEYLRRGLFEPDKLTISTQLCFKILLQDEKLPHKEVDYLIMNYDQPSEKPQTLWWMPQNIWKPVNW